jgi:hypothetical protein
MTKPQTEQQKLAREGRVVALVIAGTMLLWLAVQAIGAKLGWEARYAFLADLAAIAGFIWALVVTWRIWQRQKAQRGD